MKLYLVQWTIKRKNISIFTRFLYPTKTRLMSFICKDENEPLHGVEAFKDWFNLKHTGFLISYELLSVSSEFPSLDENILYKYGVQNADGVNYSKIMNLLFEVI